VKFTVKRDSFLASLQMVTGVVERRHTLPVLANLLFVLSEDSLAITGTDLEVEITARVSTETIGQTGKITASARKLMDICRSLSEGSSIEFIVSDDKRLTVKSGRSRFTLSTLPADDFPIIDLDPGDIEFSCPQTVIKRLLDATSFAMAQQDVRFYLNGVLWEVEDNQLHCVATDGHRLALCTQKLDIQVPEKVQAILPRKGVIEFSRLLKQDEGDVRANIGSHHIRLQTSAYTVISKLVDGKFPDYQSVLPRGGHNVLVSDRNELKKAFSRASILSNEKYRGVRLVLADNQLTIMASNPEQEEAEEHVVVDYSGDSVEIGFNVTYLQDVAGALTTDRIKMTLSDASSSALLEEAENGNAVYVVMPMRL
jgi:DNA polymerase-3 subunit beta